MPIPTHAATADNATATAPDPASVAGEQNRLLLAIPPAEYDRLAPHLELFQLEPPNILVEARQVIPHVYFPQTGIISIVRRMSDGALIEAGTIGKEGMAGLAVLLGDDWSGGTIQAQSFGTAKRMPFGTMKAFLPEVPEFERLLRRFVLAFIDQLSQAIACNALHQLSQRLAKWLLLTHDQVEHGQILLTHEILAEMLAVRRAGVSEAMGTFQKQGILTYSRGRITILDRAKLEAAVCECYATVRDNYARLLGPG